MDTENMAAEVIEAKPEERVATYLVFDTETTGLPVRGKRGEPPVPADDPRQPRVASFAAIIADQHGQEIDRKKAYIRPEGWTMAEFDARAIADGKKPASEINGLTDAVLIAVGVPVAEVLDFYASQIEANLIVVAFNAIFDTKMMRGELRREGRPDLFEKTRNICMMKAQDAYAQRGLCMSRPGFVTLAAACEFHGIKQENAHDAMGDAEDARALLEILIRDGLLPEPSITYSATKE